MVRKAIAGQSHSPAFSFLLGTLFGICATFSVVLVLIADGDLQRARPDASKNEGSFQQLLPHQSGGDASGAAEALRGAALANPAKAASLHDGMYDDPEVATPVPTQRSEHVAPAERTHAEEPPGAAQTQMQRAEKQDAVPAERAPLSGRPEDMLLPPWRPLLMAPPLRGPELKTMSIILVARNEHQFLQKTIDSIMGATEGGDLPGVGLKEIILVDDGSEPPMETAVRKMPPRNIFRILRLNPNKGLMTARVEGGRSASGDVLVFLDCHVKPLQGWLPPIMRHVNENYRRVVTPSIPAISEDWEVLPGTDTVGQVFDWSLTSMQWIDSPNDWVMILAGGLFAVSRKWWFESGEYDTGMQGWGMEQLEQAVRTWLCGGEIVVDRSSVVGHYYRKGGQKPYSDPGGALLKNAVRAVEVWFDEYKQLFYTLHPEAQGMRGGVGLDISDRHKLRRTLGCRPFDAFVQNFRPYFLIFGLIPDNKARQNRPAGGCRYTRYDGRYLGVLASAMPEIPTKDCHFADSSPAKAEQDAKAHCEELGAVCAGITCGATSCSARKGTPFMRESPEGESTQIKVCCRFEKVEGFYLRRVAYVAPVMPLHEVRFYPQDLDLALQRCEALTELCVGVSCDNEFCTPREGNGGLQASPSGEVTYIKICN